MKAVIWDLNGYSIRCIYFALALWVLVFDTQTTAQSDNTETVTESRPNCQRGYDGTYPDCIDIDECAEGKKCQDICKNTVGSYTCNCAAGYTLASDEHSCNDIDECAETPSCRPKLNSYCLNTNGSYICSCNAGYRSASDGLSCTDINECAETPSVGLCKHNSYCSNTDGSYTCSCNEGYRLAPDGLSCNDIDECNNSLLNNCSTQENFICENTDGDYKCVCNTGFKQVGQSGCRDINECESLTNNCTRYENMTCENIIGSYKCRPRGTSDAAAKVAIAVTICLVFGISLIIIAVVCFVRRAKKRKRNEKAGPTTNNTVLAATNVYDNKASDSTPSESKSSRSQASSEILYEEFDVVRSQVTNTSTSQLESSETVYENYAEASKPKTKPKPKPKPKPSDLNVQEQCFSTNVSCSTSDLPASGKADSKETAAGQSILANVYKGIQKVFKLQKGNNDLQNGEATNDSIYQDLVPVTDLNRVYEPIIIKPSKSNEVDESV